MKMYFSAHLKINCILLAMVTLSAIYVVDLRLSIKYQNQIYGQGLKNEIRLKQDQAGLRYDYSRYSDARFVTQAAEKMRLRPAKEEEIHIVQ